MSYRIGVKPSKAACVVGVVTGGLFLLVGAVAIVPRFGAFGILWTAVAGLITAFYGYNLVSTGGVSAYEVNVESPQSVDDLDASLRKLATLKNDGLLTEEEYE